MVHIGFVGLGRVLDYHLPAIRQVGDRFKITSVYDVSAERTKEIAQSLHATPCGSYEEMLSDPTIELVVVGTPPRFHSDHAVQALQKGKHVLLEKPMALTVEEANKIVAAAVKSGKIVTVNHNHRFSGHQQYPYIKNALDDNIIGRPYHYNVQLMSDWGGYQGSPDYIPNWECKKEHGGGTLLSWGPHLVDMVLHAHPAAPHSVYARTHSDGWAFDGDSYSNTTVTFEDGATAQIEISYVSPFLFNVFYVQGETGAIKYDQATNNIYIKKGVEEKTVTPTPLSADMIYDNLYKAITQGEKVLIDPRDILLTIAVLEAALLSAQEDKVILLNDVLHAQGVTHS
jgi:predicted dehydrogenase